MYNVHFMEERKLLILLIRYDDVPQQMTVMLQFSYVIKD